MKIKRLSAANIREAMRRVREELGTDAVILSNHRTGSGIEIVAAIDYDEQLMQGIRQAAESGEAAQEPAEEMPAASPPAASPPASDARPRVVWSQDPLLVEMQHELHHLRGLLEQELSGLAWGELARHQPCRADLLGRLLDYGLSPDLCLKLAECAGGERDLERAWGQALDALAGGLAVTDDDILTHGGVVALLGPTGVGKTTTVAKLAARYTLRHGPRQVALITTDGFRIGAFDQLRTFGMILDTPVRLAGNHDELQAAVREFADRPLVLIDTAGMSQRDLRLSQQFALIKGAPAVRCYLVLAANAQAPALEEAAAAFARIPLAGCVLTKLDETTRLGGALSILYSRQLPMAYVSGGQRVPEDLHAARAEPLVRLGAEMIRANAAATPTDPALALTFGRRVANGCL